MTTLAELYSPLLEITTEQEANKFITERIVALREQSGEKRTDEELDALDRASVCSWFAFHNHHHHVRMIKLFRPAWPPLPDETAPEPAKEVL